MPTVEPKPCDLLITGGHVLTVDGQDTIYDDGSIAVTDGSVVAVGDSADVKAAFQAKETIDAAGKVVLPGLANSHVHVPIGLWRNRPFIGSYGDKANDFVEHVLVPNLVRQTSESEYVATLLAGCESLKRGVTLMADGASMQYPAACADAIRESGIRGVVAGHVFDRPHWDDDLQDKDYDDVGLHVKSTPESLELVEEIVSTLHEGKRGRVQAFASIIGSDTCTDELLVGAKEIADRYDVMLDTHQSLQRFQVEAHQRRHGYSDDPMCYLERIGVLGSNVRFLEIHVINDEGIDLLAKHGVSVVNCDPLVMSMAMEDPPGPLVEMLARGVNVAVGTDDPAIFDVLRCAQMTTVIHKVRDPAVTLRLATINGARSMGLGDVTGSIEVGKEADLVIWGTSDLEWSPEPHLYDFFRLAAMASSVETVLVSGEVVVRDGSLTRVDENELRERVRREAVGFGID